MEQVDFVTQLSIWAPYPDKKNTDAMKYVLGGGRPSKPATAPEKLFKLMKTVRIYKAWLNNDSVGQKILMIDLVSST